MNDGADCAESGRICNHDDMSLGQRSNGTIPGNSPLGRDAAMPSFERILGDVELD